MLCNDMPDSRKINTNYQKIQYKFRHTHGLQHFPIVNKCVIIKKIVVSNRMEIAYAGSIRTAGHDMGK